MAFPRATIRLDAAQAIFSHANIQSHIVGGKVVYYSAQFNGVLFEDAALTALCAELWKAASRQQD